MAAIPLVKPIPMDLQRIDVNATPDEFGAGVGQAMQQLGGAVDQLGSSIGGMMAKGAGIGRANAEKQRVLDVGTIAATNPYDQQYMDALNATTPDTKDFPDQIKTGYLQHIDTVVKNSGLDAQGQQMLRARMIGELPAYYRAAVNDQQKVTSSTNYDKSSTAIGTILNTVSNGVGDADPWAPGSLYQSNLDKGLSILANQPSIPTPGVAGDTGTLAGQRKFRSDMAEAYFQGQANAVRTDSKSGPDTAQALMDKLADPKAPWLSQLTPDAKDRVNTLLDSLKKQQEQLVKGELAGKLYMIKDMNAANKTGVDGITIIDPKQMRDTAEQVYKYGTQEQIAEWTGLEADQIAYSKNKGASVQTLQARKAADAAGSPPSYAVNTGTLGDATRFLLPKLNAGHPAYYVTEMDPRLQVRIAAMLQDPNTPQAIRDNLSIMSGARHLSDQKNIPGYGRSRMVGGPGSHHVVGHTAVDFGWKGGSSAAIPQDVRQWLAQNGPRFGITLPSRMKGLGEFWHFEVVEASGGGTTYTGGAAAGVHGGGNLNFVPTNYRPMIESAATKYGVPVNWFAAMLMRESNFNTNAVGPNTKYGKARGISQLIDSTAKAMGVSNPHDPTQGIEGGAKYLGQLYSQFKGRSGGGYSDIQLALAAYNAGPGRVEAFLKGKGSLPQETVNYVNFITAHAGTDAALVASQTGVPSAPGVDPTTGQPANYDASGQPDSLTVQYDQFRTQQAYDNMIAATTNALNADMMTFAAKEGAFKGDFQPIADAGGNVAPNEAFAQRGQQFIAATQYYQANATQQKPFTKDEEANLAPILKGTDVGKQMRLMGAIESMPTFARTAALRQLGGTSPLFEYAGNMFNQNPDAAQHVMTGNQLINDPNLDMMGVLGGKDRVYGEIEKQTGPAISGLPPDQQGAFKAAVAAAYASQQQNVPHDGSRNNDVTIDTDGITKAIAEVSGGMTTGAVNGVTAMIPPGNTADEVDAALGRVTPEVLTALSGNTVQGPPMMLGPDNTLVPVPASRMGEDAQLKWDHNAGGKSYYRVLMGDGSYAVTGAASDGSGAVPYVIALEPSWVAANAIDWQADIRRRLLTGQPPTGPEDPMAQFGGGLGVSGGMETPPVPPSGATDTRGPGYRNAADTAPQYPSDLPQGNAVPPDAASAADASTPITPTGVDTVPVSPADMAVAMAHDTSRYALPSDRTRSRVTGTPDTSLSPVPEAGSGTTIGEAWTPAVEKYWRGEAERLGMPKGTALDAFIKAMRKSYK